MRLAATVPDNRGSAVLELADELGLSRSQLIEEALALFLKAVLETDTDRSKKRCFFSLHDRVSKA